MGYHPANCVSQKPAEYTRALIEQEFFPPMRMDISLKIDLPILIAVHFFVMILWELASYCNVMSPRCRSTAIKHQENHRDHILQTYQADLIL